MNKQYKEQRKTPDRDAERAEKYSVFYAKAYRIRPMEKICQPDTDIRQCEHDILFSGLFFQTSVSSTAIMKDIFHYRKYILYFTAYR